jgi:hypothetical protein
MTYGKATVASLAASPGLWQHVFSKAKCILGATSAAATLLVAAEQKHAEHDSSLVVVTGAYQRCMQRLHVVPACTSLRSLLNTAELNRWLAPHSKLTAAASLVLSDASARGIAD